MTATVAAPAASAPARRRKAHSGALSIWWVLPAVLFLIVFYVFPIVQNGYRGFYPEFAGAGLEFNLRAYAKLLGDSFYLGVIVDTFWLSALVTLICLVLGYPVAYFLVRYSGRWSGVIIFLLIAPLLTSIIMRTYGWRVLLARRGLINNPLLDQLGLIDAPLRLVNTQGSAVVGLVHVLVPFMVLAVASVLQGIDTRLEESARILGANRWQTFLRVTLPLSLDGIGTGAIMVFMIANGSFVTLLLIGGDSFRTLPLLIYQQFNTTRDFGFAAAMGNLLLLSAVGCLYLQLRLIRRRGVKG
ncbi:MAG: ABC transporter permease [Alphaproteobacteria bacterium]|nr:ABC transporter permease [Alphaproteobacteria bacterium]